MFTNNITFVHQLIQGLSDGHAEWFEIASKAHFQKVKVALPEIVPLEFAFLRLRKWFGIDAFSFMR
jgi:hypothetical protein